MKIKLLLGFLVSALLLSLTASCVKDEPGPSPEKKKGSYDPIIVTVDADGNADGGHRFTDIDGENYYIDDLKYQVSGNNLILVGYDATNFTGEAKIIYQLNYEGRQMHVVGIAEKVFEDSKILTSVTIPPSLASIGASAFSNCRAMNAVYINDLAAWCKISFGDNPLMCAHALYLNGDEIQELVIPSSVTRIASDAFRGCASLTSVTIPSSVAVIGSSAFRFCTGLTSATIAEGVGAIGDEAFYGCKGLTSMTIPSSVATIGIEAFSSCTGLTSVVLSQGVSAIGDEAFSGCAGLSAVTIPSSVSSLGEGAFAGCTGLTALSVAGGNSTYDSRGGCQAIIESRSNTLIVGCNNTTIPSSVAAIGKSAFRGCAGLTAVTIPSSVTTIGESAFFGCTGLTAVDIPSSVTTIASAAFSGCTGVTAVTIPSSVTFIGSEAFYGCSALTSVAIPSSVTSIGGWAFAGCAGLDAITVADDNPTYDSRDDCNAIIEKRGNILVVGCKNTTIPAAVTAIEEGAFYGCTGLTSVAIPKAVTTIGWSAFYGCTGLISVSIAAGVTSIEGGAFSGCTALADVYCYATRVPTTSSNAFEYSLSENTTLHVPASAMDAYVTTAPWSHFSTIEAIP